ncbi:acyltransferase [Aquabacterium sp.]|uniref:acyltransferase n=1 Tax=Aquabacterium sp. TaxID=1872578 RepID=UPI0035B252DD
MIQSITRFCKATFASVVLAVNTVVGFTLMIPFVIAKLLLPFTFVRKICDTGLRTIAETWIGVNCFWMNTVGRTRWHVSGHDQFPYQGWYLVSANHQSWVDILVLQWVFNRRIPLLKFFIKHELIYVPIIGLCWWALDFPFMKRRGGASAQKDLETARKACEKFRVIPTSVISFMEGTRFTKGKHAQQKSPYQNLLKAKTGGVCMALETMGDMFNCLVDVTIVYPHGIPTFTDLLTGNLEEVVVKVREVPIPKSVLLNEKGEPASRQVVQAWVDEMWTAKDREITEIKASFSRQ